VSRRILRGSAFTIPIAVAMLTCPVVVADDMSATTTPRPVTANTISSARSISGAHTSCADSVSSFDYSAPASMPDGSTTHGLLLVALARIFDSVMLTTTTTTTNPQRLNRSHQTSSLPLLLRRTSSDRRRRDGAARTVRDFDGQDGRLEFAVFLRFGFGCCIVRIEGQLVLLVVGLVD